MAIENKAMGATTDEVAQELGAQFRTLRINAGLSQQLLAEKSGVSLGALKNLETGAGASLSTLIGAARALGKVDWLLSAAPEITIDPMEQLQALKKTRQRVFAPRRSR